MVSEREGERESWRERGQRKYLKGNATLKDEKEIKDKKE